MSHMVLVLHAAYYMYMYVIICNKHSCGNYTNSYSVHEHVYMYSYSAAAMRHCISSLQTCNTLQLAQGAEGFA